MKHKKINLMLLILLSVIFMIPAAKAEASTYSFSSYSTLKNGAVYEQGDKIYIEVARTAMVLSSEPVSLRPFTLKIYKGGVQVLSVSQTGGFTSNHNATFYYYFKADNIGTYAFSLYAPELDHFTASDPPGNDELVETRTITVKKKEAKTYSWNYKPTITVKRTAKKKAKITCTYTSLNSYANKAKMQIYRSTKKHGKYKLIATTKSKTYTDKKLAASKTYYYKVRLLYQPDQYTTYVSKYSAVKAAKKK